jgi:hypothetical protein
MKTEGEGKIIMIDQQNVSHVFEVQNPLVGQIAREVAEIVLQQMGAKEVSGFFQILYLDVEETAQLLRVKSKTVSTWISQDRIPVRYFGGRHRGRKPLVTRLEVTDYAKLNADLQYIQVEGVQS